VSHRRGLPSLLLTAALACALLSACDDNDTPTATSTATAGATTSATTSATPTTRPTTSASLPEETDAAPDPDNPELDPALSHPVEDSVYPPVGDPSVDALHYDLDLAWTPTTRTLQGDATIELRSTGTGDHLQLDLGQPLEVSSVTLDGKDVEFEHDAKNLVVHAPVAKDQRYVLEVRYSGTPEPSPAPTNRSDFDATGWTITSTGETWT